MLLVLGIAAGAYGAVVFVPVWVLHYEVKQVVRDFGNQAVKNGDDAAENIEFHRWPPDCVWRGCVGGPSSPSGR